MSVSRPNTVMNHGIPAAGSLAIPPLPAAHPQRGEIGDRLREGIFERVPRGAQLRDAKLPRGQRVLDARELLAEACARRPGARRHGARRGWARRRSSAPSDSAARARPGSGCSRRSTSPGREKAICVRAGSPLGSSRTNWLCASSKIGTTRLGEGLGACVGSPSAKSCSLTAKMSAKSVPISKTTSTATGSPATFSTTTRSCIVSETNRSRTIASESCARPPAGALRR